MAGSEAKIGIGLDPQDVINSLRQMAAESKRLQSAMEESLGKNASQAINDLKDNAERGTNRITAMFSNLKNRVQEDLRTAFNVGSIAAGANFAKQISEGVSQVFDMERAFSRLNVRMGLSAKQMEDFKIAAGRATAEAGVNLKDVTPGLMMAASRGNVRDPAQMTQIARSLAQAKEINPDLNSETITESIAEILKRQHITMTGQTFGSTMDAINAATVQGGFKNSGDAASHIAGISGYAQQLGLDTRTMAGLAAVASKAGDSGEGTLQSLLAQGTGFDRGEHLNAAFGAQVFKDGKLDPRALAKVDTSQFGNVSQQVLEKTTGITGSSGADLKIFIDSWKENMGRFDDVVKGSNETADQFKKASDNFAFSIDAFKQRVTQAGSELGSSLMEIFHGVQKGALTSAGMGDIGTGIGHSLSAVKDHAGDLATAGALTIGAGLLTGSGIRGLIGSAAASAEGVQKVYVTNAAEIADSKGGLLAKGADWLSKGAKGLAANAMVLGGASLGEIGAMGAGAIGLAGAGVLGAGAAGYGIGMGINKLTGNDSGDLGAMLYDKLHGNDTFTTPEMRKAIVDGMIEGAQKSRMGSPLTNPSSVAPRGARAGGY